MLIEMQMSLEDLQLQPIACLLALLWQEQPCEFGSFISGMKMKMIHHCIVMPTD